MLFFVLSAFHYIFRMLAVERYIMWNDKNAFYLPSSSKCYHLSDILLIVVRHSESAALTTLQFGKLSAEQSSC